MDQVPIGNKAPRPGHARQFWCPACRGLLENPLALTSGHVLLECMAVEGTSCPRFFCFIFCSGTRIREGIRSFIDECWAVGRSSASAHFLYVNGLDSKRSKIPVKDHLKRGASLSRLVKMWLDTWGEDAEAWDMFAAVCFLWFICARICRVVLPLLLCHIPPIYRQTVVDRVCWTGGFLDFPKYQVPIGLMSGTLQNLLCISVSLSVIGSLRSVCTRLYARDRGGDCSLE